MTWKAVDGCARSRGSRSSSKAASHFRPAVSASDQRLATGRKHAAARVKTKPIPTSSRLGVRGPQPLQTREFVSMAAPGVDLGTGRHAKAGETRIPGDVAGRDKEISLLYRLRQPDCRRQAGAATLVHRHLLW